MKLYISASNRKGNCYKIMQDLKTEEDKEIALAGKNIQYCLGCCKCSEKLETYCVLQDDMKEIYDNIVKANKIIIITPIYMNHITGILKNVIDRFNPYMSHPEMLEGKTVYVITVGQIEEKENEEIANNIKAYFESVGDFMKFQAVFLRNFSSGEEDDVTKNYENYKEMIETIKKKIGE